MAHLDKNINLIERYFEGTLSEAELQSFREKLDSDPGFAKAVQLEQDLIEGIQSAGELDLRNRMDQIIDQQSSPAQQKQSAKVIPFTRRIRLIAAVAILAVACGFLLWQINKSPLSENLYTAYYETPSFDDQSRGEDPNTILPLYQSALTKYNTKDFSAALIDLNELIANNPNQEDVLLMKAICQVEGTDYKGAIQTLQSIPASSDKFDSVVWYLGLTYLKSNDLEAAHTQFQKLASGETITSNARKQKAKEIIQQIK